MAQNAQQVQTQAQQQIQTLSPQQILVVKLLELPTVEFEERIHSEVLDNPALEEGKDLEGASDADDAYSTEEGDNYAGEDYSLGDYQTEDDIPDYKLQEHRLYTYELPSQIFPFPFSF